MVRSVAACAVFERLIDRLLAGQRRGDRLADLGADALELGDRDELDAGIGHRILGRLGRVGGLDRRQHEVAAKGAAFWYSGLS